MKKTNDNFKELLMEANVQQDTIELIENILEGIATNKMSDQELLKKNIDQLIEKEVMKLDTKVN